MWTRLRARQAAAATMLILPLLLSGCAARRASLSDTFPLGSVAAPWNLDGNVWCGGFDEAADALGDDARQWADPRPTLVCLAVYRHESNRPSRVVARAFQFETADDATSMYQRLRPAAAAEFRAGDGGCWTDDGVLFLWGRLVFDIFATQAGWHSQLQAAMLAQHIQKQMPPRLPEDAP